MTIKTKNIRSQNIYELNFYYDDTSVKNCIKDICDFLENDLLLKKHTTVGQLDHNNITSIDVEKMLTITRGNYDSPLIPYGYKVYELENETSLSKTYIKFTFCLKNISYVAHYNQAASFMIQCQVCNAVEPNGDILATATLINNVLGNIVMQYNGNPNIGQHLTQNISGSPSIGSYDKISGRLFLQLLPNGNVQFHHDWRRPASTMFGLYVEKHNEPTINTFVSWIQLDGHIIRHSDPTVSTNLYITDNNNTIKQYTHNNLLYIPRKPTNMFSNTIPVVKSTIVNPTTFEMFQSTNILVSLPNMFPKLKTLTINSDTYIAIDSNTIGATITNANNTILIKV